MVYSGGVPNPDRFGFLLPGAIGQSDDFTEAIALLCDLLKKEAQFVDGDGFEQEITAAFVDAPERRYAWVEYKAKENGNYVDVKFTLFAAIGDCPVLEWEIETYNPYFGCQVELLHWAAQHLNLIYHEKHYTYACTFTMPSASGDLPFITKPDFRRKVSDEWLIKDGVLFYRSDEIDRVERLALPDLSPLESWTAEQARAAGELPDGYDEMNEIMHRYKNPPVADATPRKWWRFW